eukprot:CAMPEP_0116911506 /NCGR_PEP_ID=MMETSP0467-20121206/15527_1 /TAXON_ID=283647 /ORGANISM="Mesodinium pulex, Strain SPMC105" /LENGTH=36 /DNA_ID= /DNA_START= /DNA_END= /DNA_ORIENTATION=
MAEESNLFKNENNHLILLSDYNLRDADHSYDSYFQG